MPDEPPARLTQQATVRLRALPAPDALDLPWPDGYVCLVTDDGSRLSRALCRRLSALDRPVVALRLPLDVDDAASSGEPMPDVPVVALPGLGEEAVGHALATVVETYGPVATLIYLQPSILDDPAQDQRFVRAAFLLAKHLHGNLTAVPAPARAAVMTVSRLDGALGVTGTDEARPIAGGFPGLTKTLRLEWPGVFCRALDLAPAMAPDAAAAAVVAELHDPNLALAEVGSGPRGRVTLVADLDAGGEV